jgi:hypothetical protein
MAYRRLSAGRIGISIFSAILILSGSCAADACSPARVDTPEFCIGKPDGTVADLQKDALAGLPEVGVERLVGKCRGGLLEGPGTIHLNDAEKFVGGWDSSRRILPGSTRTIVGDFFFGSIDGIALRGSITAYDENGRIVLQASYSDNGGPGGPFSLWSSDGTRTDGAFHVYTSSDKLGGGLEGRIVSRYAGGGVAAVRYFCAGLPVGRHWHFDASGKAIRTEDFTASDYAAPNENIRDIMAPTDLPPKLWMNTCGGHPFYDVLQDKIVRRTIFANGRPDEIAIARYATDDLTGDRFTIWRTLPNVPNVDALFLPGTTIEISGVAEVATASVRVREDRKYAPLRDDLHRAPQTWVNAELVRQCGAWLDEAFGESPPEIH